MSFPFVCFWLMVLLLKRDPSTMLKTLLVFLATSSLRHAMRRNHGLLNKLCAGRSQCCWLWVPCWWINSRYEGMSLHKAIHHDESGIGFQAVTQCFPHQCRASCTGYNQGKIRSNEITEHQSKTSYECTSEVHGKLECKDTFIFGENVETHA